MGDEDDLPVEGMASLDLEMAPSTWVVRIVDLAGKVTTAQPGAQIVEREFGMFELHATPRRTSSGPARWCSLTSGWNATSS
jgi:hypothetical protein